MTEEKFISDDIFKKKLFCFKVLYFVGAAVFFVYILKFNIKYKVTEYNSTLIPLVLFFSSIPPTVLKFTKNYLLSALLLGCSGSLIVVYMLYISGGVSAPGVFWLASIPLSLGILIGLPGTFLGYAIIIVSFLYFQYLKYNSLGPNIVAEHGNYSFEKIFNLILFLLFSSFTTHQYVKGEERWTRRLIEKNKDIDNLLRVLLHDIANALSSITYNLIQVKKGVLTNNAVTDLEKIEKSINDINNLLGQVRHLKSVKDGKASLPLGPVSLPSVLNEIYENNILNAQEKNLDIHLDITCDPMLINGEKNILCNVILSNIMSNAIKFSHAGGDITVKGYCSDSYAFIEIQDNGIGIPENILKKIFDVNTATSRQGTLGEKGTGYGMPLVKEYLTMMNGTIDICSYEKATSEHPQGTKVTLRFPQLKKCC
ncbi:MAG: sensor histidine kinase [Pseudobdellovibrionaceae bacterium]